MGMGKIFITFWALFISITAYAPASYAQDDVFNNTGLPIPRFVSLRSDKVFVRTGPALRYPIKWVFRRQSLPVEVIQEFDTWRKIRDHEGQEGWIHQSLTQGRRYALVTNTDGAMLRRKSDDTSKPVALVEPMVIARLEECEKEHCFVSTSGFEGWTQRKFLYGIYADEKLD
ncbi:MAG: hypothetical protein HRT94_06860 [Alphaproteobacteria bacterium]|nr:hypothetical protein [Alphaproteobacteria bacterium]